VSAASERFAKFLEAQKGEYRQSLPGKVGQAEASWAAGDLEGLQRLAHTVYGSAGTYGFAPTGQAAREVEEAVQALRAAPGDDALRARAQAALAAFRASLPPSDPQA
jgi:HPt (histidine-containing phosphotransfer) domain-containing protein